MDVDTKLKLQTQEKALIYIRDALSFYLTGVRVRNNVYNIIIIIISMTTAFFETLKTEFEWDQAKKSWLRSFATIAPIGMSTFIAFISTMMKFERITEKMEDTTKSIEKCHYAINKQRETRDKIPVVEAQVEEAVLSFREAIMNAEMLWLSRMDPKTKREFLKRSDCIHDIFADGSNDVETIKLIEQSFRPDTPKRRWIWRTLLGDEKSVEEDSRSVNSATTDKKRLKLPPVEEKKISKGSEQV